MSDVNLGTGPRDILVAGEDVRDHENENDKKDEDYRSFKEVLDMIFSEWSEIVLVAR